MKKLNISSQFLIVFISIILFASTAFSILTMTRIRRVAEQEVYSRLSTYVYLLDLEKNNPTTDFPDMNVEYLQFSKHDVFKSPTLNQLITDKEIEKIFEIIEVQQRETYPNGSYTVTGQYETENHNDLYYVFVARKNLEDFTFLVTDDIYPRTMAKNVAGEVILLFFLFTITSICIIYLWSTVFVTRIRKIQHHIINLPKNKYKVEYVDDSLDEIGELSRSIEDMRIEIGSNEETKREMLQNISHDFKTPIAVIKSYAEAQLDGMADEDASKIIIAQTEILKKKVNRLLQYNSLEYLEKNKEFEEVDMNELITEVVTNYKYLTDINIELDLSKDIKFNGYKENFYTVVDNILDNAKRYAKTKIKIVLRENRLRIYNDGDHIDEQFLNSVFKPYEKGSKGEFGLGMSIVKKTLDFFNYNLKVVNEEIGVSFIITKNTNK
jgi:two-component system sensor histidine kinase CssS